MTISETDSINTTNYIWDYENRLIGTTDEGRGTQYEYDSFGKRTRVTEDGITTKYLYDGGLPIIEKDATETTIATYTRGLSYGGGIGGIVSAKRDTDNYYYHYNGLGSATALTDETSAVVATYNYDAYGNTLSSTGSIPNPYGFSTKEFSNATGLAYFGARYYNPQTGRWLSPDPLGMVDGPNLYAYVNNNPTNLIDPWGLEGNGGNFPGGNYTPDDGTGEQNPSGGSDSPKTNECSGGQPTNPDESLWDKFWDEFNRNRFPGASWFSPIPIPRGPIIFGGSEFGARGLERMATREATRNFSSFSLGKNAAYVRGLKPGYFKAAAGIRFLGTVSLGISVFYFGADIGTALYAWWEIN